MNIIGINASHNATACLVSNGKLLACISEERLTGVKNQYGLPQKAYSEILRITSIKPSEIDKVVFGYTDPKVNSTFASYNDTQTKPSISTFLWNVKEQILVNMPFTKELYDKLIGIYYNFFVDPQLRVRLLDNVEKKLKVSRDRVEFLDHHKAHAYSACLGNPHKTRGNWLVLTFDAMGDGVCSTVNTVKKGKIERIACTSSGNSLGDLYAHITGYLGMKMGEHEYKVMGLAPYANEKAGDRVYQKLKKLVWINKDMTFSTSIHSHMFYKILPKILYRERFDSISFGIQKLTEEILVDWVKLCIGKTGIKNIALAGGIFMNVKANQKISELNEVERLFIMPSCGDESTAIGAAYWGYEKAKEKDNSLPPLESLGALYLGEEFSQKEIARELAKKVNKKYKVKKVKNIEKLIAKLISDGNVVARFNGRMEWGARALGNRSILAHPAKLDVIRTINDQIKSRDFWMPFAPSIMKQKADKYIIPNRKIEAAYMIITFDTTLLGKKSFASAMHQYDFTLRPQFVDKLWNPSYYKVLEEFEKLTQIGGVLNTSFNLHGFPIVCTPRDAMNVFANSGLKYIAIGQCLVSKK